MGLESFYPSDKTVIYSMFMCFVSVIQQINIESFLSLSLALSEIPTKTKLANENQTK